MLKLFINGSETQYLEDGSVTIQDQIQNKANVINFNLIEGATEPAENESIQLYDTVTLVSASGTTVIVKDDTQSELSVLPEEEIRAGNSIRGRGMGKYREGQTFWLDIGGADEEKVTIQAVQEDTTAGQVKITTTKSIANSHSAGESCGKLVFAGTLSSVQKKNKRQLTDVWYQCTGTDYTKIFDKKNVNDSWQNVDARYIINDFCNTTINFNKELDDMDYANDAAVQAEWIESGDGGNPTNDTTNNVQGSGAVNFPWTNSGGTATFSGTPASSSFAELAGATTGAPTKGNLTLWYKRSVAAGIASITVRVGSDASNYVALTFTPEADTEKHFISIPLEDGTVTGTPNWAAIDYLAFVVAETANGSITVDDVRITADGSFTLYNVEETLPFDDARASFKKPTVFIDQLAKALSYYWFIDYERDIHFFDRETNGAPFSITDTSNNFDDLEIEVDTSQLKNRQVVRGGVQTSTTFYSQVVEGNSAVREWILKSKFKNLTIALDDGSTTAAAEVGTTTANIKVTGHGLSDGDYVVNRTRSNAVREITYVDADNFTVEAVTGQTNGDSISFFATSKTVGIEGATDETTVDYVSNFNEKTIRATESEATLDPGDFLLFTYNEVTPIRVQVTDPASIATMKALIGGDGIFDGAVITDQSIDSAQAARDRAQAEVDQYSNPIVTVRFRTDFEGLESGQILTVSDTNKNVAGNYVIQRVRINYKTGDYAQFDVTAASSLFGIIEYFQKLSRSIDDRIIDENEEISQIANENVTISVGTVDTINTPAESASEAPTVTVTPSETATERNMTTDPYKWQPHASDARWNLAQWG